MKKATKPITTQVKHIQELICQQLETIDCIEPEKKKEIEDNSWTRKRYEMAQRMGTVERVAMQYNLGNLPFTNEKLASAVGKTAADFESLPVSRAAIDVVFDALVESKASLLAPDVLDRRRGDIVGADGSFNELAFRLGLYKARSIVIASWFMFASSAACAASSKLSMALSVPCAVVQCIQWSASIGESHSRRCVSGGLLPSTRSIISSIHLAMVTCLERRSWYGSESCATSLSIHDVKR